MRMTDAPKRILRAAAFAVACTAPLILHARPTAQQPPDQRPPVFRGGAYFVTVDVYPLLNGRIVDDLTLADFDVLEDGRPQKIESFEFVRINPTLPEADLRDPNSQREMLARLSDPRTRVFVLYLDTYHIDWFGAARLKTPIVEMMRSLLAPTDLFAVMLPLERPRDLVFARTTRTLEQEIASKWPVAVVDSRTIREPLEARLEDCYNGTRVGGILPVLFAKRREDSVLTGLEDLTEYLGALREGRKHVFVFTNGWRLFGRSPEMLEALGQLGPTKGPPIGITSTGKLILGDRLEHGTLAACDDEVRRLAELDNGRRFRDMIRSAPRANVAFYPVEPEGVGAPARRVDDLRSLASESDGLPVVMTNDLRTGLDRIAGGLSGYYLLGYSSTNTTFDGGPRRITVRVRRPDIEIKARRGYVAPTEAEIAALRDPPIAAADPVAASLEAAFAGLARLRPSAVMHTYAHARGSEVIVVVELPAAEVAAGRWKGGGDVQVMVETSSGDSAGAGRARIAPGAGAVLVRIPIAGWAPPLAATVRVRGADASAGDRVDIPASTGELVGDPIVWRVRGASRAAQPAAAFLFRRSESIRIEWPVLAPIDRRQARLLGRNGQPLGVPVRLSEREADGTALLVADVPLAPLAAADYVLELEAASGSRTERKLIAFRVGL